MTGTTTFRGCESEIPEDAQDDATACDRDGCNKIIFPDDRIKCVKCSSNDDFCTTPDASLLYPCKNYEENDSCYTYVIGKLIEPFEPADISILLIQQMKAQQFVVACRIKMLT